MVIVGGRIIDSESGFDEVANIGIVGGTIAAVSENELTGKTQIDARGLAVTPGFIDILSMDPNPVGEWNKISDGITTVLGMHGSDVSATKWLERMHDLAPPLNYGGSYAYTRARADLRIDRYSAATSAQITELTQQAAVAIREGFVAISMSLEYAPGVSAEECIAMTRLARRLGVPVFFHVRYSSMNGVGTNLDAIEEILQYARLTGASVHIEHINSTGGTHSMKASLALLDAARASGVDVTACLYPYNYWATYLNSARFDEGWQERFGISYADLQLAGTPERLTKESFDYYRQQGKLVDAFAIPEADVVDALQSKWVMMGSDGMLEESYNNHPRASGMCARLIGQYARDRGAISLMDAIAKLTILPARRLEHAAPMLRKKGRISVGADADITILDLERIRDNATPEHPEFRSDGVSYVIIGGKVAKTPDGRFLSVSGMAIRSETTSRSSTQARTSTGPDPIPDLLP